MATVLETGKAEDFKDIPVVAQEGIGAQEFETKRDITDEQPYTVERFNGEQEHDGLLEKRRRILDKMMRDPLPDEFVLDVENVVARRLQEQDDKPELARSSAFDRLVAANLPPDNKSQSEWEKLVLGLRRDKAAGGYNKSVDDIFAEVQSMGGRAKLERLQALKTFGLAARRVDVFSGDNELKRQAEIFGELVKLRANIIETNLAMSSQKLSREQKEKVAADSQELFSDYTQNDSLPIRFKNELEDSANKLRIFLEYATAKKADATSRVDKIKVSSQQDDIKIHPEEPEKIVPAAVEDNAASQNERVETEQAPEPMKLERYRFFRGDEGAEGKEIESIKIDLEAAMIDESSMLLPPPDAKRDMKDKVIFFDTAKSDQDTQLRKRALPEHLFEEERIREINEMARQIGDGEVSIEKLFAEAENKEDVRQLANLKAIGLRLVQINHPEHNLFAYWADYDNKQKEAVLLGQMMAQRTEAAMLNMKIQQGKLKEAVPVKNARQFAASFWKASQDQALPEEHRRILKNVATKLVEEYQNEPGFNVIIQPATGKNENTAAAMQPESPPIPEEPVEQKTVETPLADQYPERAKFSDQARQFNEQAKGLEAAAREIEAVQQGGHLPAQMKEELRKTLAENASLSRETGHYIDRLEYDLDYGRNLAGRKRLSAMFNRIGMRMQVAGGIHSPRIVGDKNSGFWQEVKDNFMAVRAIFSRPAQQRVMTARDAVIKGLRGNSITAKEYGQVLADSLETINNTDRSMSNRTRQKRQRQGSRKK